MSSHSVRLAKALRDFERVKQSQKQNTKSEYTRGFYNGLELAWAMLQNKEPVFIEKTQGKPRVTKGQLRSAIIEAGGTIGLANKTLEELDNPTN